MGAMRSLDDGLWYHLETVGPSALKDTYWQDPGGTLLFNGGRSA